MKPTTKEASLDLGIYGRKAGRARASTTDIVAGVLSAIWLAGVLVFLFAVDSAPNSGEGGPFGFIMTLMAVFLPIAMIWVAAAVAKTARVMREEAARLQAAIDAMRHAYITQQHAAGSKINPVLEKRLDEIVASTSQTESAIATFSTRRSAPEEQSSEEKEALPRKAPDPRASAQKALALAEPEEQSREPISVAEFIRAVNFPENEDDEEGFRTLRKALRDRDISRLIRSAQDVLTLLSQDGIYMDDLSASMAEPAVWRRFAEGARGSEIAALAGIRDRSCLALSAGRLRKDPVFRDAVHHFLRQFDTVFSGFAANASDAEITAFARTRSALAFMLLGRVAGTFD